MASCFAPPNPSLFIALQEPKNLAQGFNPEVYTQFGKRRIPEKLRSIARTNYRLEAYATLRRRVAAVVRGVVLPHDLELSLDAPKSNVA